MDVSGPSSFAASNGEDENCNIASRVNSWAPTQGLYHELDRAPSGHSTSFEVSNQWGRISNIPFNAMSQTDQNDTSGRDI